jgi:surface protein
MFSNAKTDNIILTGLSFPKCTLLDSMFSNAEGTTLDLSSWDISDVTSMYYMFNSTKYKRIDLTGWKTTNVTDMSSMFSTYNNPLIELIIPDWDMTKVTSSSSFLGSSASYMKNLKLIDLSRSNDATIIKIASLLFARTATTFGTVLVPENTSQEAYDALVAKYWRPIGAAIGPIPTSCNIVAELDEIMPGKSTKVFVGNYEPWNADPSKVELVLVSDSSIATMTDNNEVISTGVLGDIVIEARLIDTQEVIGTKTISVSETDSYPNLVKFRSALNSLSSSNYIHINGTSISNKVLLSAMDYNAVTDIYTYDAGAPITYIKFNGIGSGDGIGNISELVKLNTSNITSMYNMFYNCSNLTTLDLSNFDTSNVTSMADMFYFCESLITLDLSNFDTSKVTNMANIFSNCTSLTSLNLSNWDTSNVTTMGYMFSNCTSLHTLRLDNCSNTTISKIITSSKFPTNAIEGVTRTIYCKEENAAGLTPPTNWVFSFITEDIPLYVPGEFSGNTEITEVVTMVNESHTNLSHMFDGCTNLVSINTQDWDTSNVTRMVAMFRNCTSLTSLDLSNWDTSNVTSMTDMFCDCSELEELNLSGFSMPPFIDFSGVFMNCNNLRILHLKGCDVDTASFLMYDADLPTGPSHNGFIYITNELSEFGLEAPEGWTIEIVD